MQRLQDKTALMMRETTADALFYGLWTLCILVKNAGLV